MIALAAALAAAAAEPAYRYEVTAGPGARVLEVELRLAPGSGGVLVVGPDLHDFVEDARSHRVGGWESLSRSGAALLAPECESEGCTIRYRFQLGRAAAAVHDLYRVLDHNGSLLAPPSSWLLRPLRSREGRYRFRVVAPPDVRFVTGVSAAEGGGYEDEIGTLERAAYSGFGPFANVRIELAGGVVDLAIAPGARRLSDEAIERWVRQAGSAVSAYFGRLPGGRALVLALPGGERPIGFGTMRAGGGAAVMVFLGREASEEDLARDWVLAHELSHLGFPDLSGAPDWIEEGLATYLEPLARAQAGLITAQALWTELLRGLPRGLGAAGDGGLDSARGYPRIYWGGALYWLLCDLELRERTGNARGLQNVLRAMVVAGADGSVRWPLDRALDELERAAGHPVFRERQKRMAREPAREDLESLWRRLGVAPSQAGVVFDEGAPLAAVRRALGSGATPSAAAR
jgi:hypothetical protein